MKYRVETCISILTEFLSTFEASVKEWLASVSEETPTDIEKLRLQILLLDGDISRCATVFAIAISEQYDRLQKAKVRVFDPIVDFSSASGTSNASNVSVTQPLGRRTLSRLDAPVTNMKKGQVPVKQNQVEIMFTKASSSTTRGSIRSIGSGARG